MKFRILLLGLLLTPLGTPAQESPAPLTSDERTEVVDSISNILNRAYVYPEVAEEIAGHLGTKLKNGDYDDITDPEQFAGTLTEDVRSVNGDKHLRVGFLPDMIATQRNATTPEDSLALVDQQRQSARLDNYGFKEVKILEGNIGYLNLTGFYGVTEEAGHTAQAAMNFLSNADALIIDLRQNGGGSPQMIQLITSYLYGTEPVHLNSFYYRPQDEITQTWTLPFVPGKRRPDMDVYVLTSGRTFSAAEEFSYNLRNLERATLVGEVTGGGAHPGGTQIATDRYAIWVPTGRAINPVTNTNWEGTGVQPHIEVPQEEALEVAKMEALQKIVENCEDENLASRYRWTLENLEALQEPASPEEELLRTYAGQYGPRKIEYRDGILYYQREGNPEYRMIPMSDDTFIFEDIPYFRLRIIRDGEEITGVMGMYQSGRTDQNPRSDSKP